MKIIKKDNYFIIFFYIFIFILIYIFFSQIISGYQKESWQITEWLINYQGGFVRRGLWGEIILNLYRYFGVNPYIIIILLCACLYFSFLLFFIKLYKKKGYPLFVLPFVFFLGNPIINNFWVRKDILLVLLFSLILYFSNKKTIVKIFIVNLVFILGLLTHESIGFFGLPILFLIFYKDNLYKLPHNKIKSVIISVAQLLPAALIFLSCLYYKGSTTISNIIWNSWKIIKFPIELENSSIVPASIDGLSWSLRKGLELTISVFHNFNGGIYAPIAWFAIILSIYYLLTNLDKINVKISNNKNIEFNKINISSVLIFQLVFIIPLFVLGWDYGRWVFLWVVSSFLIVLLIPKKTLSDLFPKILTNFCFKVNNFLSSIFGKIPRFLFFLVFFIGVPSYGWSLVRYLETTSLGFIFKIFLPSFIVSYIKTLVL